MLYLPPEIWCIIAGYLPSTNLKGLYGVNRVFFDLAMNERYGTVWVDQIHDRTINTLENLTNPSVAHRVQIMGIAPHSIRDFSVDEASAPDNRVLKWFKLSIFGAPMTHRFMIGNGTKRDGQRVVPSSKIAQLLMDVTSLTVNVRHFNLHWGSFNNYPTPYIDRAWLSFGHHLQELTLFMTTTKLINMFPLPTPLPLLRALSITIYLRQLADHEEEHRELLQAQYCLAGFINSLSNALESLRLRCLPIQNLSILFDNIGHLSVISSFDLDVSLQGPLNAPIPANAARFLQRHGRTIRELTLSTSLPSNPWGSFQLALNGLQFSKISSLTIDAGLMACSWNNALSFLTDHSHKLKSLVITGPLAGPEVTKILDVLNHLHPSNTLSHISLAVYQLDVKFLDKLAMNLRRLKSLTLRIHKIACDSTHAITPSQFFPHDSISGRVYPFVSQLPLYTSLEEWQLCNITIKRRSCCGELILWGLMTLCAKYIPSIKSFAQNEDMVVSEPPQAEHKPCAMCTYTSDHTVW